MNADKAARAVVLLSGGLDSAVVLALARERGLACEALSFDYGQRHAVELRAAAAVATMAGVPHRVVRVDLRAIGGSALTQTGVDVPRDGAPGSASAGSGIPVTYVPARNLLFLSVAIGLAEVIDAAEVHIGVNAVDYSGYPDCRPEFLAAFAEAAARGTRAGALGRPIRIEAPLLNWSKARIIQEGARLGVDFSVTNSCYSPSADGLACGQCESCGIRRRGFKAAGVDDQTAYAHVRH